MTSTDFSMQQTFNFGINNKNVLVFMHTIQETMWAGTLKFSYFSHMPYDLNMHCNSHAYH